MQRLQFLEEAVALAVLPAGAAFLGALVVLVHVLKLLLALLGASLVPQVGKLPESHSSDKDTRFRSAITCVQPKTRAICEEEELNDGSVYRRKHLTQWHNTSRGLWRKETRRRKELEIWKDRQEE